MSLCPAVNYTLRECFMSEQHMCYVLASSRGLLDLMSLFFLKEGGEAEFALRISSFSSLTSLSSNLGLLDLNGD